MAFQSCIRNVLHFQRSPVCQHLQQLSTGGPKLPLIRVPCLHPLSSFHHRPQQSSASNSTRNSLPMVSAFHQSLWNASANTNIHPHFSNLPKLVQLEDVLDKKQKHYVHTSTSKSQSDRLLSTKGLIDASPANLQPYLKLVRLDRPTGTWLIYLPCMWSIALAAPPGCLPDLYYLAVCSIGALLMRGAGCTINDMWDKDYDSKVERTRDRPLACDQISNFQALRFLGLQLTAALGILLSLNWYTISLGSCVMSLVVVYPLAKRFTYWPHVFLGVTLNWGALIGWSAVMGSCDWSVVLPLYSACVAWTCIYDTIYAHQDKEDDLTAGVKSLPLKLGESSAKPYLATFASVMTGCLALTGYMADQTWPFFAGVSFVGTHLAHQIYTVDLKNGDDCFKKFRSNRNLGLIFFAAIIAGNLLRSEKVSETQEPEVIPLENTDSKESWTQGGSKSEITVCNE